MVIIITGASHIGKTLLAQKMLEKYKYPYLSIDHLKMGLIRSGYTDLTPEDDDELTDYLWPIILEMIKTVIENNQNLIVEGCYIPPDWRKYFDERYLENITFICLAMSEEYIENHFDAIIGHESEIENRSIKADCTADDLKQCNRWFIESFSSAGEKVVIIEDDFNKTLAGFFQTNQQGFAQMMKEGLYIGADGCRGGWIIAVLKNGGLILEKHPSINSIVNRYPAYDEFLIDMAIGLRDDSVKVRPDDIARKELSPRGSTVFPIPSRSAVYSETEEEQKQANLRTLGKSLPKQTINIIPKIRELDEFLEANPEYKNRIFESHPELSFARLRGEVLLSKKKDLEGFEERRSILADCLPEIPLPDLHLKAKEMKCNPDDLLDAVCLAVTAALKAAGRCETIPGDPDMDEKGLFMQLTVPKKGSGSL